MVPGFRGAVQDDRRNEETFSADIVPSVYRGKVKHKLVFSGLNSKFSAVYDMGYSKDATASHLALQQFISDHGISQTLITDGDQAENFSQKWIELCVKLLSNSIVLRLINRTRTMLNDGYRRLRPQSPK
jgi:hypothetical protein